MDPWKDFYSNLFAYIVSSLSPVQILGRAKVFCKILGPAKIFSEKFVSSLSPVQILGRAKVFCKILGPAKIFSEKFELSLSPECLQAQMSYGSFHSSNESYMVFS